MDRGLNHPVDAFPTLIPGTAKSAVLTKPFSQDVKRQDASLSRDPKCSFET
jgi:hypothetical protein